MNNETTDGKAAGQSMGGKSAMDKSGKAAADGSPKAGGAKGGLSQGVAGKAAGEASAASPSGIGKAPLNSTPASPGDSSKGGMAQPSIAGSPFAEQIGALQSQFNDFQQQINMADVTRAVADLETRIHDLPNEIEQIRSRGYAYRSYLENKAEVLQQHWDETNQRVHQAIDDEVAALRADISSVEKRINSLGGNTSEDTLSQAESALSSLKAKADAAEERIQALYESLSADVQSAVQQITEINWFLDQKDEASFDFLAGESLFLAAKAEWVATGKGKQDPDGILYLTDQRLIFEQKEKTGKKLGMFGGKQEQELEWELPLSTIDSVEAENKGMFGGKDMLNFQTSSSQHRQITVEVKGGVDCKLWQKQIQRMVSGDAANERAIEPDPEVVQRLREAPTACHVCGGTLPRIVAGQTEVTCSYCGAVIRI